MDTVDRQLGCGIVKLVVFVGVWDAAADSHEFPETFCISNCSLLPVKSSCDTHADG